MQVQSVSVILDRRGEGFETSPAPNQSDRARIIMATRAIRPIRVEGNIAYVTLTRGYEAVIDAADVPLVEGFNWAALVAFRRNGDVRSIYAVRRGRDSGQKKSVLMHRAILGCDSKETDHIDGDGLNNRRSNLRPATKSQNMHNKRMSVNNKSGAKGVHWCRTTNRWIARIVVSRRSIYLGCFEDIAKAASAYEAASARLHGEFGRVS